MLGKRYVYRLPRNRHIVLKRGKPIYISTKMVYSLFNKYFLNAMYEEALFQVLGKC